MSLTSQSAEREKYGYILELAKEQVKALEGDDFFALKRVLAAKGTLIESLVDGKSLVASDPVLKKQALQIMDLDKTAQKLMYRKVGRIMREMAELQRFKKANNAYATMHPSSNSPGMRPNTPVFMDRRS